MIVHIARREWLEQRRQPLMLGAIGALFGVIAFTACIGVYFLDRVAADPELVRQLATSTSLVGDGGLGPLAETVISVANWLVFTQYLGICAVLAGHALLHDREKGTLPFLLLAPVGRVELLVGKVLGALGPATALYLLVDGVATAFILTRPIHLHAAALLPPSPAWFVAFLVGAPAWAAFVSTVCAIVSSTVADVRTAQQIVWLVMFFATFLGGFALSALLPQGAAVECAVAAFGLAATAIAVWGGSLLMRRDLSR